MNQTLEQLRQLQDMDTRYIAFRKKLRAGPEELAQSRAKIDTLREESASLDALARQHAASAANYELEAKTEEAALAANQKKLEIVKNKKEYDAIQTTSEEYRKKIAVLQESAIQLLGEAEAVRKDQEDVDAQIAALEEAYASLAAEIQAEVTTLNTEIANLKTRRQAFAATIDDRETLEKYEQTIRSRDGIAVAAMKPDGTCQACFRSLTPNIQSAVMSERIVKCAGCGRFLYLGAQMAAED